MNTTSLNTLRLERRSALIRSILATFLGCALALHARAETTEELHKTYALTETGRISLDNVNGSIHIATWDRAEVKLDAVKSAKKEDDLKRVEIIIDSTKDSLTVKTKYASEKGLFGNKNNSAKVEYTLTVPRNARLDKISNVNGNIELEGVQGEVDASTVNGRLIARKMGGSTELSSVNGHVTASFDKLDGIKTAKFNTVNGGIDLALPAKASATLKANTVNGGIANEFDLPVKKHFPIGQNMDARLGDGDTVIKLSTVNGAIRVNRASAQ